MRIYVFLMIVFLALMLIGCGNQQPAWEQRVQEQQKFVGTPQNTQQPAEEEIQTVPETPQEPISVVQKPHKVVTLVLAQGEEQTLSGYVVRIQQVNETSVVLDVNAETLTVPVGQTVDHELYQIAATLEGKKVRVEIKEY